MMFNSRRIFSPKSEKRGRGGRGVWGEFRRARAFRRAERGGSGQVPLLGLVYQIWQNDFKSMPRRELVLLRGL
jgi:hypothetical protein